MRACVENPPVPRPWHPATSHKQPCIVVASSYAIVYRWEANDQTIPRISILLNSLQCYWGSSWKSFFLQVHEFYKVYLMYYRIMQNINNAIMVVNISGLKEEGSSGRTKLLLKNQWTLHSGLKLSHLCQIAFQLMCWRKNTNHFKKFYLKLIFQKLSIFQKRLEKFETIS